MIDDRIIRIEVRVVDMRKVEQQKFTVGDKVLLNDGSIGEVIDAYMVDTKWWYEVEPIGYRVAPIVTEFCQSELVGLT